MNSKERHEARYQRRIQKRKQKQKAYNKNQIGTYDQVFSYPHLYRAFQLCTRGVRWKASIQKQIIFAPTEVEKCYRRMKKRKFKPDKFYEFDIKERGHDRHIKSVTVRERGVQRCLCDYALVPAIRRSLIYDNGASMENKGYSFAIRRMETHLHQYYRKYGSEGYVLLFDFSKFFDNVSHAVVEQVIHKAVQDKEIQNVVLQMIRMFGDKGLGLGSQVSQIQALASANRLDHYVKEMLRIKWYGRYMDDGYLIHPSKEYLQHCLKEIRRICDELGIVMNTRKTQIVKLSHGFTFLKARVYLTSSGKVIKKIYKHSVVVERRKLKRLKKRAEDGKMTPLEVFQSFISWRAYARNFMAFRTICGMEQLVRKLFPREQKDFPWFSKKELRRKMRYDCERVVCNT